VKVSALEIARGRWELDTPRHTEDCGCRWVTDGDELFPELTRRVFKCETCRGPRRKVRTS